MIEVIRYISNDGKLFDSPEECLAHEDENIELIDNRFNVEYFPDAIYYISGGREFNIQRVKFVGIKETTEIQEVWGEEKQLDYFVKVIESVYNFIGVDDPTQEFNCWCESQLPTSDLRSLFNFDIAAELAS